MVMYAPDFDGQFVEVVQFGGLRWFRHSRKVKDVEG